MFAYVSDYSKCLPTIHLLLAETVTMNLSIPRIPYNIKHIVGVHICLLNEWPQLKDIKA